MSNRANPKTFDAGTPGPYAVVCRIHGQVFLTDAEYNAQMNRPGRRWECPAMDSDRERFGLCGAEAEWDDDNYDDWASTPTTGETEGA